MLRYFSATNLHRIVSCCIKTSNYIYSETVRNNEINEKSTSESDKICDVVIKNVNDRWWPWLRSMSSDTFIVTVTPQIPADKPLLLHHHQHHHHHHLVSTIHQQCKIVQKYFHSIQRKSFFSLILLFSMIQKLYRGPQFPKRNFC